MNTKKSIGLLITAGIVLYSLLSKEDNTKEDNESIAANSTATKSLSFISNPDYITKNQNFVFTFSADTVRYYECIFFLVANSGAGNEVALLRIGHGDSWNARFIKLDGTDDFGTPYISVSSHTAQVSFPIIITGSSKISIMPLSGVNILSYNIV